jgi:transcriptional regulator with XRE-family HTH domain
MAKSFDQLANRVMSAKSRARAERRTKKLLIELLLSEIRKLAGKSQGELAKKLGIKQPSLSKLENQDDMQISTLKRIIEALGGEVHIVARFPNGNVRIKQFDERSRSKEKAGNLNLGSVLISPQ